MKLLLRGSVGPHRPNDRGLITLIISVAALIFSLGTLVSDVIRNRNLLIHDLQVDGQVFHNTLISLDRMRCLGRSSKAMQPEPSRCVENGFFDPNPNSNGREILLQRAEYLEKRIAALLKKLDMHEFGYITPVDYRTLAKEELKDLNFEKSKYFIDREVEDLKTLEGHPDYVLRSIHADLMDGWYFSILNGKRTVNTSGKAYFERAMAKAHSSVTVLPLENYLVVSILQSEGCANWIGKSLFYSPTVHEQKVPEFDRSGEILRNEPPSFKLLYRLRHNQSVFDSGRKDDIMQVCTRVFDEI
ncbi:MAG: hypothetical protein ACYCYP_05195 [Leptospirales bacterium]